MSGRRRFLAHEVVQTSMMDCGPASLKSLLEGFGVSVSYGRLREACQTDVDGTSIDTLEDVAIQLGLDVEQVVIPPDHIFLDEDGGLPALAVVVLPGGATHFVVLWRRLGPYLQIMDPGTGRRWVRWTDLLDELYIHQMPVAGADWLEWARGDEFLAALDKRLRDVGVGATARKRLFEGATDVDDVLGLSSLDAAVRMSAQLVRTGAIRKGREVTALIDGLLARVLDGDLAVIPGSYWFAHPIDDGEDVMLRGAVILRVHGVKEAATEVEAEEDDEHGESAQRLSPELVAALDEQETPPLTYLLRALLEDGVFRPFFVAAATAVAAFGVIVQALLFKGLLEMRDSLGLFEQRLGLSAMLLVFLMLLLLIEVPIAAAAHRMGRAVEVRLRLRFLQKLPRLSDHYFKSRLSADMAERAHAMHYLRMLPQIGKQLLTAVTTLAMTTAGIIWLAAESAPVVLTIAAVLVVLPFAVQPLLVERDLRVRTHLGGLTRFYLDALLGLIPIRTHGAQTSVRREHERQLTEWARGRLSLLRMTTTVGALQSAAGYALVGLLVFTYVQAGSEPASLLLLVYWTMQLPGLGESVASALRRYPALRNVLVRILEPLGAPEHAAAEDTVVDSDGERGGAVAIELQSVSVRAGGHEILDGVDLRIEPGEHVAIVGASGAGKSSLVGLLLGWYRPSLGRLIVDGRPLDESRLDALRSRTVWVDPAVQIWNRTLLSNLRYGSEDDALDGLAEALDACRLDEILDRMPDGLQTSLGEGGALVSGGEGQRVRLGRGMLRRRAGLTILDEPFRGLDRPTRRAMLESARGWWKDATLLCVTHDISETRGFDRVLVIEDGKLVEDGHPGELAERTDSRYRALLDAENALITEIWQGPFWRRVEMQDGGIKEQAGATTVSAARMSPFDTAQASATPGDGRSDGADDADRKNVTERAWSWPVSDLEQALGHLARDAGLSALGAVPKTLHLGKGLSTLGELSPLIEGIAAAQGLAVEPVEISYGELNRTLRRCAPAVVVADGPNGLELILIRRRRGQRLEVLGPDLQVHTIDVDHVREALCGEGEAAHRRALEDLLASVGVSPGRQSAAVEAMLKEMLGPAAITGCFILRQPASAPFWDQLRHLGLLRRLGLLIGLNLVSYALFLFAWWLIGRGALSGVLEGGWLAGWVLVLLSMVLVQTLASWTEGLLALGSAVALKARLLLGALRLEPSTTRDKGAGQLMGQVFESEAVESMSINGGFLAIAALVELAMAAVILALGPSPQILLPLFGLWVGVVFFVWWKLYERMKRWTDARVSMTEDLVERMVGHRTRLAQQSPARRHDGEDERLAGYLDASGSMDRAAIMIQAVLSRGWLIIGIAGLMPVFLSSAPLSTGALAVGLGGVILAGQALGSLGSGLGSLAQAAIAWRKAETLFHAAARDEERPAPEALVHREKTGSQAGEPLLEARDLVFRHPGRPRPTLTGCSLRIAAGERILIEGASGSGKSTLGSILVGLRKPDSGLLLFKGLDRQTLGAEQWHSQIVSVPQFHENHILAGPLAFNALMGKEWPAGNADIARAQEVFEALGLGELLQRMPSGMLQMVGDTGWQLSHGERSRLFIARALLQGPEMIVFDESFAALDPQNMRRAVECVLQRAPTVVVIAHP